MSTPAVQPPAAEEVTAESPAPAAEEVIVVPAEATPAASPAGEGEKPAEAAAEKTEEAVEGKKEEKSAPHAITHGTLSKNSHGALLSFFKQKRFFYFQDDAITEEKLRLYLGKESASKSNAAYAVQTGKGLWFYTKDESRKDSPHGIIKLADVTDIVQNGTKQFVLKLSTGDLHFEASPTERDNWVFTLKAKIEEAKASVESVTESDAYKTTLEKLSKSAATAKPAEKTEEPKDSEEAKANEPAAEKTDAAAETGVTSDEEAGPSDAKDVKRSASKKGKRSSKFSDFFGGKKEKTHDKEGEVKEEKSAEASETAPAASGEPAAEGTEEKKAEDEPKASEESATEGKDKATGAAKRHSFFRVFEKKGESAGEKKDKEVAEAAKEVSTETAEGEAKPEESPAAAGAEDKSTPLPSSPPKAKFLALLGKRDKSPSPKAVEEKPEPAAEVKTETPVEPATEPAAAGEAAAEAPKEATDTPAEATSPATKEKRKTSFFSFKKEKKAEDVKSDSEDTEPAASKASASPVPKGLSLTSLKRKVSRAGKSKEAESKEVVSPPVVAEEDEKDKEAAAAEPETAEPVKTETEAEAAAPVIGDVVPDAVTVGQSQTVQAAA